MTLGKRSSCCCFPPSSCTRTVSSRRGASSSSGVCCTRSPVFLVEIVSFRRDPLIMDTLAVTSSKDPGIARARFFRPLGNDCMKRSSMASSETCAGRARAEALTRIANSSTLSLPSRHEMLLNQRRKDIRWLALHNLPVKQFPKLLCVCVQKLRRHGLIDGQGTA